MTHKEIKSYDLADSPGQLGKTGDSGHGGVAREGESPVSAGQEFPERRAGRQDMCDYRMGWQEWLWDGDQAMGRGKMHESASEK